MEKGKLLEAVDRAIEALQEMKSELQQPSPALSGQGAADNTESGIIPQTSKTMAGAVQIAAAGCGQWKFQDDNSSSFDVNAVKQAGVEQDAAAGLDPDDDKSYYIVSPDGAIGLTENAGRRIDWMFLPLNRTVSSLPKKLKKGDHWPEKVGESNAQASAPAPAPEIQGAFCKKCGSPLNPGARFCMKCRTPN